jgi:hypothetical protein
VLYTYGQLKSEWKRRKFDQCEDKSPASRLTLRVFCVMNGRNEDERECRICLLVVLLLLFYINYEKNVERLCRLIISVLCE